VGRIVVVWVHVVAAAVGVGGLLHTSHLVLPAIARGERAYVGLLAKGRLIGWLGLGLLVVTGLENLRRVGLGSAWLAGKLVLVIGLLALAAHRDFALLPRAARLIERGGDPGAALSGLRWLDRIVVLLALATVFLAVGVARGR
jgi:uncharacterized membrane protein